MTTKIRNGGTITRSHRDDGTANPVTDTLPLVLSVPQAARLLGVSKSLVYDLIARNELPRLRLGRRVVIPTQAFLAFIAGGPAD